MAARRNRVSVASCVKIRLPKVSKMTSWKHLNSWNGFIMSPSDFELAYPSAIWVIWLSLDPPGSAACFRAGHWYPDLPAWQEHGRWLRSTVNPQVMSGGLVSTTERMCWIPVFFFFLILVPPPGNSRTESQLRQPETGKRLKWESWNNKSSSWSWR